MGVDGGYPRGLAPPSPPLHRVYVTLACGIVCGTLACVRLLVLWSVTIKRMEFYDIFVAGNVGIMKAS
jgi:hypothetical protein